MLNDSQLSQILLEKDYVSKKNLQKAQDYSKSHKVSLVDYLLSEGFLSRDLLGQAMAEFFKVSYADLNTNLPSKEQIFKISESIALKFRAVLFSLKPKKAVITTDNPKKDGLKEAMALIFPDQKIEITYSLEEDIDDALISYKKALETRFSKIIREKQKVAPEIIDEILNDSLTFRASDIHLEPQEKEVVVRFRIDGVLQDAGRFPKEYFENIVNRLKVKSHLRTDEHFAAQDGSIRHEVGEIIADLRVSIVPTLNGEKIVIRVLANYIRGLNLADLGLSSRDQEILAKSASKPFGMILITGPTGSGKTTTLYALLKTLNSSQVNITTIEDPVEYKISGINQIQVNQQTNLTFAKGLRSIVRQDPDIILVGEIRDIETAEIAVNAALTGHLLLSTFHANDASTGIPRLIDMGIEPFLLSSTLEIIVSQRLARKICDNCRESFVFKASPWLKKYPLLKDYFDSLELTFYEGKGCSACNNSGYKGRTAVFEIIKITPEIQDLILKKPSGKQIWELAKQQGALGMFEDGMAKVKNGIITFEELIRVVALPE